MTRRAAVWAGAAFVIFLAATAVFAGDGTESTEQAQTHTIGIAVIGVALPIIGWLIKRDVAKNDESIKLVNAKMDKVLDFLQVVDKDLALVKRDQVQDHRVIDNLNQWKDQAAGKIQALIARRP